jgi:hypothetical protein
MTHRITGTTIANLQLGQKLCPNLHDRFYTVLRGSTTFGFDGVASGRSERSLAGPDTAVFRSAAALGLRESALTEPAVRGRCRQR